MDPLHPSAAALSHYLASNRIALHELSLEGFRDWLAARIREHEHNEVFRQKRRISALVKRHCRRLRTRETIARKARAAYEVSTHAAELAHVERRIVRLQKAVHGLDAAVREGRADPAKLAAYQSELGERQATFRERVAASPERKRLDRAEQSLGKLRVEIGLADEELRLQQLQRGHGRRAGTTGRRFEETAAAIVDEHIIPRLDPGDGEIAHLRGVTLGCARGEFDHLIVRSPPGRETVDVLAMVEAKRNPNDIVGGFLTRQENIAWLTGATYGYDPHQYRTRAFPTGQFDRPATHDQEGRTWRFDRSSFSQFEPDPVHGYFLKRLFLVTAARPLRGATSVQLSTILHWIATDSDFDLESDLVVRRYRKRVRSFVDPFQTRDVLQLYDDWWLGEQILFGAR